LKASGLWTPAYEFPGGLLEVESEYKLAKDRQALLDLAK
jgi:hypothetical protein